MDAKLKYHKNRQSHIQKLNIMVVSKFNSTHVELWPYTEAKFVTKFIEQEMAIYDMKKEEQMEMLKKKIASRLDSYVSMNLSCFFSMWHKNFFLRHNMCLFDVSQCKKIGISTEHGGVSTDTQEAHHPSDETTPTRWRRPKMQVRRKEVESVTDVVHLTSYSNDAAPAVVTINIGNAKAIILWILTPDKQFSRYLNCGLQFVNFHI